MSEPSKSYTAFAGTRCIASGEPRAVTMAVKTTLGWGESQPVLVFDDTTGRQIDLDLSGSITDVFVRLGEEAPEAPPRTAGRPKLGVTAREVTLLPRHWDWLAEQPGGASAALRRLVEVARNANAPADKLRRAREAAYKFMTALAGNLPDYEEATRALFAGDGVRFGTLIASWPGDVRSYALRLAAPGFETAEA